MSALFTLLLACTPEPAPQDTQPQDSPSDSPADSGDTGAQTCTLALEALVDAQPLDGSHHLGSTAEKGEALTLSLTLHNPCAQRLRFLGHPDEWVLGEGFSLGTLPPVYLDPDASATLELHFQPGDAGEATGSFRLPYDLPSSPLELSLSATVDGPLTLVFVGDGRHVLTTHDYGASFSTDAYETTVAHGDSLQRGVCASPELFVSVGGNVDSRWWRSVDGDTWTAHSDPSGPVFAACAYGDGRFVAATSDAPWTSTDGLSWSAGSGDYAGGHLRAMAFSGGTYVAVGDSGKVSATTDGSTWQIEHHLNVGDLGAVAGHGQTFVAVGDGGTVVTSTDGAQTWSLLSVGSADLSGVVWAQDRFVAGGGGQLHSSLDGTTWSSVNAGPDRPVLAVGPQIFALSGASVLLSEDGGFSWTTLYTWTGGLGVSRAAAGGTP
ncbi:MAG: hypothetical protein VX899_26795 [Myxococcota bacterium]|nr:hypothetical protein [Myxococcota bacterium]